MSADGRRSTVPPTLAVDRGRTLEPTLEQRLSPPMAGKRPHITEIHGERLVDDYHWLRDKESPDVARYLEAENAYTESAMAHVRAFESSLYDEMVGRIQETDLSVPVRRGDRYYYVRTEEGKQYPIYARKRERLEAEEEVLLDVNVLAEGQSFFRLGVFSVSPDHRLLAFAYDLRGSEDFELRFKDLSTGEPLDDVIEGAAASFAWGNDNRTVFYTRRNAVHRPDRVCRHVLGQPVDPDAVVYRDEDDRFYVFVYKTRSERFIVAGSGSSVTSEQSLLDADAPAGDFRIVRPRIQGVEYDIDHHGDHLYVRTNQHAKSFRLERIPVRELSAAPEEIISHRPRITLESVMLLARHMVVLERDAGLRRLRFRRLEDGRETLVALPESVYSLAPGDNPEFDTDRFRIQYTSPVTPRTIYDVDLESGALELLKQDEVLGGYDPGRYETRRLFARARDGVAVPVVLLYKRGRDADEAGPCLLYGYGAYGATMDPSFSSPRLSLVDRGVVFALANVRGGGALGEDWHDQGKMLSKKNTFTDFIDVAELLIEQRYTTSGALVIQGGSAGGLLVGTAINLRPDLFHAAVAQVPFVDVLNTMLDESIPLTVGEFEEWGNPKEKRYFEYIRSYAPYENVTAKDYPHLLITAGLNDPRVQYWEPAKWAAKLRAMKKGDQRLLLKTNMGAGHGGASGRYDALKELAFIYAFILDTLGISE